MSLTKSYLPSLLQRNLFSFLTFKGYNVVIINPLLISNYVKLQLRKTKTDKKDAFTIALFLLHHHGSLSKDSLSSSLTDLRDLARQRESLVEQMTALKSDIKRMLTITFPELERITGIFTKSVLRLLCDYPSAHALRQGNRSDIAKVLKGSSRGKNSVALVDEIIEAAHSSIGTVSLTKEVIVKQKVSLLIQLEQHLKEIASVLMELCQTKMQEDIEILTSIKGIGKQSAINFLVEIGGNINTFKSYKQLIAMAGLDPSVYQSGKYVGQSKISKRGNRHLRRVIWLMGTRVIFNSDVFRIYYQKRREDGLPYKKAVLATAHKLIRIIFSMLSHKTLFVAEANSR